MWIPRVCTPNGHIAVSDPGRHVLESCDLLESVTCFDSGTEHKRVQQIEAIQKDPNQARCFARFRWLPGLSRFCPK